MKQTWQRRRWLTAGLGGLGGLGGFAGFGTLGIGASLWPATARACEFYSANMRIIHPWTRATTHGATHAVVCMKFDEVTRADRLIAVETPVATAAQMGGAAAGTPVNFLIPQGQESSLDETGTCLQLIGLKQALAVGTSYPLQLVFEQAGVVNASLTVDYADFRFT